MAITNGTTGPRRYVAYLRVSTERQGKSGLGLEAQREAVARFMAQHGGEVIAPEFVEVESGRKDSDERPELAKAIARCRATGATLLIAKLDRLSRRVSFLARLMDSTVDFVCADNPHATRFTLHILAAVAEHERDMISQRTKAALAASKARGKILGGRRDRSADIRQYQAQGSKAAAAELAANFEARGVADSLRELEGRGLSLQAMARELNAQGILTLRNGKWTATAVKRALARLGRAETMACAITAPSMRFAAAAR